MSAVGWLREESPDEWRIDRIDPCEAGTCGHAGCWQDDAAKRPVRNAEATS